MDQSSMCRNNYEVNTMIGFMEEVMDTVNRIVSTYIEWLRGVDESVTLEQTEKVRDQVTEMLDMVLEESDPMKIAKMQLLSQMELKK